MYDDEECCNNGHRDNILDPHHTHVSLGIAYDDYYFAYVQNFENIYLDSPSVSTDNNYVRISGKLLIEKPSFVTVTYDEYPTEAIYQRDKDRNSYDHGEPVAYILAPLAGGYRIAPGPNDYYVMEANRWSTIDNNFNGEFSLDQAMKKHGRGVYTMWLYAGLNEEQSIPILSYSILKESS
jgi:hypothetical protein